MVKLTTIIRPLGLDFNIELVLNQRLKMSKYIKHIRLMFKQEKPCKKSKIINKDHIESMFKYIINRRRALNISMNHFQRKSGTRCMFWKRKSVHLGTYTRNTLLTYITRSKNMNRRKIR